MESFRRMYTISRPAQRILTIPSGFNQEKPGKRPTAVIAYTPVGARFMTVHGSEVNPDLDWEIRDEEVDNLLADLDMREHEHLELESHPNTALIVRAYQMMGSEKVFGTHEMHSKSHCRVELRRDFADSQNVYSSFNRAVIGMGPSPYHLGTDLGVHWLNGNGLVDPTHGFVFWGPQWRYFCEQHHLSEGMVMVLEHHPGRYNYDNMYSFNAWFYNRDGSEYSLSIGVTRLGGMDDTSLYKKRSKGSFQEGFLRLSKSFNSPHLNVHLEPRMACYCDYVNLRTLGGDFQMRYTILPEESQRIVRGDWERVFEANEYGDNPVKYQVSLNNNCTRGRGPECVWFAVEFIKTVEGYTTESEGETSFSVSGDSVVDDDEDGDWDDDY